MSLGKKQELFTELLPILILYILSKGYKIRMGDLFRSPDVFGEIGENKGYGHPNSCHKLKLAIDLNIFKDGKFLSKTEDHKEFGEFWESLHPLCRWGGRFKDGNHYSLEHNGMM